jgi:beta-lactamase class A
MACQTAPTAAPIAEPRPGPSAPAVASPPVPATAPLMPGLTPAEVGQSSELQARVEEILAGSPGVYGVVVEAVTRPERVEVQAERVFRAASVYKILVAYAVLQQISVGRVSLDDQVVVTEREAQELEPAGGLAAGETATIRQALRAMMGVSSNAAARVLLRLVGPPEFQQRLRELGLVQTRIPAAEDSTTDTPSTTTPTEMARVARGLATGALLSGPAQAELEELLRLPESLDPVPQQLPRQAVAFTKLGELDDASNVVGWITTPQGPVVISIFSEGTDPGTARATIAELTQALLAHFGT